MTRSPLSWTLIGPDGLPWESSEAGSLGGHRRGRIFGRLDCPAALRAIANGGYIGQRVFFLDESHARGAGYRPCAVCLPAAYAQWKAARSPEPGTANSRGAYPQPPSAISSSLRSPTLIEGAESAEEMKCPSRAQPLPDGSRRR